MIPKLTLGLQDSEIHGVGSGAELFIVEGESAAKAVCGIRDPRLQAVLPMQGKPLNSMKASLDALHRYDLFVKLSQALGFSAGGPSRAVDAAACRYDRVIFLFDPDADGIHCGALMLMYFYRQLRPLLESSKLFVARAPMFEISYRIGDKRPRAIRFAYLDDDALRVEQALRSEGAAEIKRFRYRGLAGISREVLLEQCVDKRTRNLYPLTIRDAQQAIAVFCG